MTTATTMTTTTYPTKALTQSALFAGIAEADVQALLTCRSAQLRDYDKGRYIWRAGAPATSLGVLCRGQAQVISDDLSGKRSIHATLRAGEPFGGAFVCAHIQQLPHSVIASERCRVLHLNYQSVLESCSSACKFHQRLIENMLSVLAEENLRLKHKLRIVGKRSTRDKLLTYLRSEAKRQGTTSFTIAFNRQELADYLGVERSALSAEISRLRDEGILDSDRSTFHLK